MIAFEQQRIRMLQRQIMARGIADPKVHQAFLDVQRELFLPDALAEYAYEDSPLGIERGQTISQPYIVAVMAQSLALHGDERVL